MAAATKNINFVSLKNLKIAMIFRALSMGLIKVVHVYFIRISQLPVHSSSIGNPK